VATSMARSSAAERYSEGADGCALEPGAGIMPATFMSLSSASSGASDQSAASVIVSENSLPGDPQTDWLVGGAGDLALQGFATAMSVNVGETVYFKINAAVSSYHIDILRLGYYQGNGARKVAAGIRPTAVQSQLPCLLDSSTGLIDCGNWSVSASWPVPGNAVSGVYVAHLVRDDTGGGSLIPFVVRDDASHSDILVQTSDATWQAYNTYGGNSLYQATVAVPPGDPMAYKGANAVSYNRPWHSGADDAGASWILYAEWPLIMWLEQNGYDVSYTSESDVAAAGALLKDHKVFVASGHDEYWSADQRANVTAARDAGVNLVFLSGNEIFWKTRWAADSAGTPHRTLICYKETHYDPSQWPVDPQDPPTWTGTWMDPRFSPPADGASPQNALTGQLFVVNSGSADTTVPSAYSALRLWRHTPVANLAPGESRTLAPGVGTLGYEWDVDADNGFRPAGLFALSSTTVSNAQPFTDYGTTVGTGTVTHHLTLYKATSGALVFGAGTVQWAWGLSDENPTRGAADSVIQQATVNLLADMGVQPASLAAGLVAASASTDTTAPSSVILSPAVGQTVPDGSQLTISGTASDSDGVVAGVEVSVDGGRTWHPATISGAAASSVTWSYDWVAHGYPSTSIMSRAVDDSGNLESQSNAVTLNVSGPVSLFGATQPAQPDRGDPNSVELGVKFTVDTPGTVTGIRFYKAAANTGTHVGNLWSASGELLASVTFTAETAAGWQIALLAQPVQIAPGATHVASYLAPNGHYAATNGYFYLPPSPPPLGGSSVDSPPLHAARNTGQITNGVYVYSAASAFPTLSYQATNYWVDVLFAP